MICLGDSQIKIPVELLRSRVIVGVDHSGLGRIGDLVALFYHMPRQDHVFIKDGLLLKAACLLIGLPAVGRAYVRAEEGLDPKDRQVLLSLQPGLFGVVEGPGISLDHMAVLSGKLPGVCRPHIFSLKGLCQVLDQIFVTGDRVLGHKDDDIRIRLSYPHISGTAVVELRFFNMGHPDPLLHAEFGRELL